MPVDTNGSILIMAIGNRLLHDDAVGLHILERLRETLPADDRIDYVDGGTMGLTLLGWLADRQMVLLLDAIERGGPPGTVHVMTGEQICKGNSGGHDTAHGSGAATLLGAAALTGDLPENVIVIGVEPAHVNTAVGLSPAVEQAVSEAVRTAQDILCHHVSALAG